jgi:hypothetical protein
MMMESGRKMKKMKIKSRKRKMECRRRGEIPKMPSPSSFLFSSLDRQKAFGDRESLWRFRNRSYDLVDRRRTRFPH